MTEYISREDVLETLRKANIGGYITDRLLEIPAADVQPVKHGYWTDLNNDAIFHYECSCCKEHTGWHEKYCPNCGAKMIKDGDTNG